MATSAPFRAGAEKSVEISVVVPTHLGADRLPRVLGALAGQTLDAARFEVVVVHNGPDDGTGTVIEKLRTTLPSLRVRLVRTAVRGVGNARNLGVAAACGQWVTFVDDDDDVTPEFLAGLLADAAPGTVPIAPVRDVDDIEETSTLDTYLNVHILAREGTTFSPTKAPGLLGFTTSKLALRAHAAAVAFRTDLRSGEDVVYWYEMFDRAPFRFAAVTLDSHAVYRRAVREGTISRRDLDFDFAVSQRLDVIAALHEAAPSHGAADKVRQGLAHGQTGFINRYLRAHPEEHPRVIADIRRRGLVEAIPYRELNRGLARDLAILYAFTPYADTSALVAARRIHDRAVPLDVISNSMAKIRDRDDSGHAIAHEFLDRTYEVHAPTTTYFWYYLTQFVLAGHKRVCEWVDEKGPYRSVYSRAMWPASHVLAALVKLENPQTRWIAEFSDPQLWNAYGERRVGNAYPNPLWQTLAEGLREAGFEAPADLNVPHLVELLAFVLADELIFTNRHQLEFMLERLPESAELAQSVRDRSVVSHHPTLPRDYYHRSISSYALDASVVNIGYFGVFYSTRGLTEVVDALKSVTPVERARLRLHVFTADPDKLATQLAKEGLDDVVVANPFVPFFEFLNLTTRMDVLLINDARTAHVYDRNPYLPSKWSDYSGSGSDVWAIVEDGSTLSGLETAYRSSLGDVAGAVDALRAMIRDREDTEVRPR